MSRLLPLGAQVEVDFGTLDGMLSDYVMYAMVLMRGRDIETGRAIDITVDGAPVHTEIDSVVLAPNQVRRVLLRSEHRAPETTSRPSRVVATSYYVCERTDRGRWSVRPYDYRYEGEGAEFDWFDIPT